ncbi:MAG: ribosome maturation factor RimP [Acidimicrobiales bacterium]
MSDQMGDELFDLLAPTVAPLGLELVDVEVRSGLVRVVVDGPGGVDLAAIAEATRCLSDVLDGHDPLPGHRYTLEVSSPGVERPLRTPRHFVRAVGETVSVRTTAGTEGERRLQGRLVSADGQGVVIQIAAGEEGKRLAYGEIERARTVFEWGATPRPGRAAAVKPGRSARPTQGADRERVTTP